MSNIYNNGSSMYGVRTLRVTKFIIQRAGTYNAQFRRPYVSHVSQQSINRLQTAVENKSQITAPLVAGMVSDLIMPDSRFEQAVQIGNGWNTPRLRFLLEVEVEDHMGAKNITYVNGFTDHADVSYGNLVDPNMPFYINNIARMRVNEVRTPVGNQFYKTMVSSSQVLTDAAYKGALTNSKVYSMRPENVIGGMELSTLRDSGDEWIMDTTSHLTSRAVLNSRSNNIAPSYIATTLDGYLQAARGMDTANASEIYQSAERAVASSDIDKDDFMSQILSRRRRNNVMLPQNFFTLSELLQVDPNADKVMTVMTFGNDNMHQAGSTQNWDGSDGITLFATSLAQALPGYMSSVNLTKLHFLSTNMTIDGGIVTNIAMLRSLDHSDKSREADILKFRLNNELLMSLSRGNIVPFNLSVNCDFLGETWIEISLNSGPMTPYVFPTFCDSLLTPIVTSNQNVFNMVTDDFNKMATELVNNDGIIARQRMSSIVTETGSTLGGTI